MANEPHDSLGMPIASFTPSAAAQPPTPHPWGGSWGVVYAGGQVFMEIDDDGQAHGWAEVATEQVTAAFFTPADPTRTAYLVHVDGARGERPIVFRRRTRIINTSTGEERDGPFLSVLGIQQTVRGVNVAVYAFIDHQGNVQITTDKDRVNPVVLE